MHVLSERARGADKSGGWRESGMDAGSTGGGKRQPCALNQMGGKRRRADKKKV